MQSLDLQPGTVILLDNVRFHHSLCVKELAKQRQWDLLYTPPYSPWFNPVEGVFSVVKRAYYRGSSIDEAFRAVSQHHLEAFMTGSLATREMPGTMA